MKRCYLGILFVFLLVSTGWACNIPVFRYALERWQSDSLELLVFHVGALDESQQQQLERLRTASVAGGGSLNLEVRSIDLEELAEAQRSEWEMLLNEIPALSEIGKGNLSSLPFAVLRGNHLRGPFYAWSGSLGQASQILGDSPVRQEVASRLLGGDSIVWLLVKSSEQEANAEIRKRLSDQLDALEKSVQLPEGIGLPGSELYSEVPLFLKYSILEIDRDDVKEGFLLSLFRGFQPEAFAEDRAVVVPVFGRGRALEVIPADQLSGPLIADLTRFLSAACSCQVKEQNPGFDLLMHVDWQRELFGEDGEMPPPSTADGLGQERSPVLLQIPPGRK